MGRKNEKFIIMTILVKRNFIQGKILVVDWWFLVIRKP
jgi:hypothetical protein